jgi:hypothetical protein
MFAIFKIYSQVSDADYIYEFIGVYNNIDDAKKVKMELSNLTGCKYHDYIIKKVNDNENYQLL